MKLELVFLLTIFSLNSLAQDNEYKEKVEGVEGVISLTHSESVDYKINELVNSPLQTQKWMSHVSAAKKNVEGIFTEYKVPVDFIILGATLSEGSCQYENENGSSGFFAMPKGIAIKHGLTINRYVDQRKNIRLAGVAFAKEVLSLKKQYANWDQVATAYALGANHVQVDSTTELSPKEQLRISTLQSHLSAYTYIYYYHELHDIIVTEKWKSSWENISVDQFTTLYQLSTALDVDYEQFKEVNAQYIRELIPGDGENLVSIPSSKTKQYAELKPDLNRFSQKDIITSTEIKFVGFSQPIVVEAKEPEQLLDSGLVELYYHVRNGDILLRIADYYDCEVVQIKRWNRLRSDDLDIDQPLRIMVPGLQLPYYQRIDEMTNLQRRRIAAKD